MTADEAAQGKEPIPLSSSSSSWSSPAAIKATVPPLRATVVDPRPLRLRRYARKAAFGMYTRNVAFNAKYNDGCARAPIAPEDLVAPAHLRIFFETAASASGRARLLNPASSELRRGVYEASNVAPALAVIPPVPAAVPAAVRQVTCPCGHSNPKSARH